METINHCAERPSNLVEAIDSWIAATDRMQNASISLTILPSRWPLDKVIETFVAMNTTGTRIEPEELRAALERAKGADRNARLQASHDGCIEHLLKSADAEHE